MAPSSSVTGGALLGDRVRIDERPDDDGRYVRSLATRAVDPLVVPVFAVVVDPLAAIADGAPQLHDDVPRNSPFEYEAGDEAAVDAFFTALR